MSLGAVGTWEREVPSDINPEFAVSLFRDAFEWYQKSRDKLQYTESSLEVYDAAANFLTQRAEFAKRLAEIIGDEPEQKVLEIAAGTGLVSTILKKELPESKLAFIDLSQQALEKLKKRVGADSDAAVADFFKLPVATESIDKTVIVGGYRYVGENEEGFWQEMARILKPGGSIYVAQFKPRIKEMAGNDVLDVVRSVDKPGANSKIDLQKLGLHLDSLTDLGQLDVPEEYQLAELGEFDTEMKLLWATITTGKYEFVRITKDEI